MWIIFHKVHAVLPKNKNNLINIFHTMIETLFGPHPLNKTHLSHFDLNPV
jgi:hypothetical protein